MFSLKTVANQLHAHAVKHFGGRGIQKKSTLSSKQKPSFDEKYTEVVDRLIRQSQIHRQKSIESRKGSKKPSARPDTQPKPKNAKNAHLTITKNGNQFEGKFLR